MICAKCSTTLPDEAIACWKCGTPIHARGGATSAQSATLAPERKRATQTKSTSGVADEQAPQKTEPDILLVVFTFLIAAGFFVCAGWAVPFTIWGTIIENSKRYPDLSGMIDTISGLAFFISTAGFFAGTWWISYWLLKRIVAYKGN